MRTLILVIFTVFVLSLGFLAYWWLQPTHKTVGKPKDAGATALPLVNRETEKPFGPGKNIWVKKFDPETANVLSRFKADDYQPRNDGWVVVKQPRAQFFMKDHHEGDDAAVGTSAISVEGQTGEIIMDDTKTGMKAFTGSRDTPSRGRLYGVTIHVYHNVVNPEEELDEGNLFSKENPNGKKAALTVTLNNASFDSQTFKIYSEGYGKGKNHVDADQVPVVVDGDDYRFDGKGLVIRWNERDRRLQLLEVAHGERLEIKHPKQFMNRDETATASTFETPSNLFDWDRAPLPLQLVAKNKGAAADAIKAATTAPTTRKSRASIPKPKIIPNTDPPLYRAIFSDDVKVVQGADLSVTSARMTVDFLMQDQESRPAAPTTRPSKKGTSRPSSGVASTAPSTEPVRHAATTTQATRTTARKVHNPATTNPASTQPADGEIPVVITWKGKLLVEPLSVGPQTPIKEGDAIIRFEGAPVTATQQGSTILSGTLTYRTEDQAMLLTPISPDKPVVLKDVKGTEVHTTRMDFFQPKHQAVLYGNSNAVFAQEDAAGKPSAPMLAKWTKTCTLYFAPSEGGDASSSNMNIDHAELDGEVNIDHPQLKLRSDQLDLAFNSAKKPTTNPTTNPTAAAGAKGLIQAKIDSVQASIGVLDLKILDATGKTPAAGKLEAVAAAASELETKLAAESKTLKDINDSGKIPALAMVTEHEETQKAFTAARANLDAMQKQAIEVQDLQSERAKLVKHQDDLRAQLAGKPTTRPAGTQPTTRPAIRSDLRQLVATGTVHCQLTDSAQKTQTIDCNRLTLQTATAPDGRIYPNTVNADGEVHAVDPEQDLKAGHLAVVLKPSTRPSSEDAVAAAGGESANAELQSLIAHQNVIVVSKDGTVTKADQLLVDNKDGKNNLKLLGQPYATIVDKKNTISGPIIEIFPDGQRLEVVGAGNMKGTQQDKPGEAERPLDVTWARGMTFNGKTNVVDVTGQVQAITKDADGATNTAKGERMKMLLVDAAPTTRPTTAPTTVPTTQVAVATSRPTTGPTTKPAKSQYDGMASKTVRSVQFEDAAEVSSVSLADDGSLLRRVHLLAQTVNYDMILKKMLIPVEGRMIVEDHRPATQPTTAKADGQPGDNNRGTTAFSWSKRFTYEEATRLAMMEGDLRNPVVVVHKDESEKGQTFRLTGDNVGAELEEVAAPPKAATQPATVPTTGPATRATTKPAEKQTKVQIKRVIASGHLYFVGPGAEIKAEHMEFDPNTHWLVARGSDRELVDFNISSSPGGPKLAEEVQYNLDTGQFRATKARLRN